MNKKAESEETVRDNIIYFILLIVFFMALLAFIFQQMNGAKTWSEFYAKEIARTINDASPGDTIELEIQQATKIAQRNDVRSFSEIFTFNNAQNEVCVGISAGKSTCYSYFNEVDITSQEIELGLGDKGTNVLKFKITEKKK